MTEVEDGAPRPAKKTTSVGVVAESGADERRVALVPKAVTSLVKSGVDVIVESGAGGRALLPDDLYTAAGATIGDAWSADVVVKVAPPSSQEVAKLHSGQTLVGFLAPRNAENQIGALKAAGVQAFAVEAIPRISRAQVMDALSSQANVAGYKAVILAASESTRFFPMLTTAAGTVKPATLLVLGVGVAGLQALATAKRLGAKTTGYDVRPEVADQVRSVGAQWLNLGEDEVAAAGEGGYARELTEAERARQQQALEQAITRFDVVITTALVPGRPAPRLVTAAAVAGMKSGSVVIDLAGETGGNCELTEPGRTVVRHGVTIASPLNLPATMPEHASELYAKNVTALLELLITDGPNPCLAPDFDDEVVAASCVTRETAPAGEPTTPGVS
jgi:NAD(P) transhydrogenase subunit alpha